MLIRNSICAALLAATMVSSAVAATLNIPSPSVWKLNVEKSDFGGYPKPVWETITIAAYSPASFKWTQRVEMPGQGAVEASWSGPMDGTMQPMSGQPGVRASFKDDQAHFDYGNGAVMDVTFTLSPDGKTLTEMSTTSMQGHSLHTTQIFELSK